MLVYKKNTHGNESIQMRNNAKCLGNRPTLLKGEWGCVHGVIASNLRAIYFFAICCECPRDFWRVLYFLTLHERKSRGASSLQKPIISINMIGRLINALIIFLYFKFLKAKSFKVNNFRFIGKLMNEHSTIFQKYGKFFGCH